MSHKPPNTSNDTNSFNRYSLIGVKEWEHETVTFYYNHDGCPFPLTEAEQVINDVVARLNHYTNLTYVYGGLTDEPHNANYGFSDGQVTVGWGNISNMMPGVAKAMTRVIVGFDWIDDAGVAFNNDPTYQIFDPANNPNYLTSFEYVLLHELTHIAGINHTSLANTVMHGNGSPPNSPGNMAFHFCDLIVFDYKYPSEPSPRHITTDPTCFKYPAGDVRQGMLGRMDVYIPVLSIQNDPRLACAKLAYLGPTTETPSHMHDPTPVWRNKFYLAYFDYINDKLYDGLTQGDFTYTNVSTTNGQTVWLQNVYVKGQLLPEARFDRLSPTSNQWLLTYWTGM